MAKRRNKNKWWYWLGGVILVGAVIAVVVVMMNSKTEPKNEEKEETEIVESKDKEEEEEIEETEEETEEKVEKEEVAQYDGDDPNEEESLSGVITYAGKSGEKLMIRVNINQYLGEGTCDLVLKRDGTIIYSDQAEISGGPTTATCEGFDVPTAGLAGGDAEIEINLSSGGKTGKIEGEVEI